jgi:outer membrane protein
MKSLFKIAICMFIVFYSVNANAQQRIKLGYINSDSLMLVMPGVDTANAKLQAEYKTYQTKLAAMQEELNTKYTKYQAEVSTMSALIKDATMGELQDLNARIESFSAAADSSFSKRRIELLKPIQAKALAAIEEVSKENGYTFIFDSALGTLLYKTSSDDITSMVKNKLGIKK